MHVLQTSDKHWYMLIVAAIILWQCIATDVYAFHWSSSIMPQNLTTLGPDVTSAATTVTTATTEPISTTSRLPFTNHTSLSRN